MVFSSNAEARASDRSATGGIKSPKTFLLHLTLKRLFQFLAELQISGSVSRWICCSLATCRATSFGLDHHYLHYFANPGYERSR